MLLRNKYAQDENEYGLVGVETKGDKFTFTHTQDIDNTLHYVNQLRKYQRDNGFTSDRSMRYIGTVPALVAALNPEMKEDATACVKWLHEDPVGRQCLVNKQDTGKSGKIRVN